MDCDGIVLQTSHWSHKCSNTPDDCLWCSKQQRDAVLLGYCSNDVPELLDCQALNLTLISILNLS